MLKGARFHRFLRSSRISSNTRRCIALSPSTLKWGGRGGIDLGQATDLSIKSKFAGTPQPFMRQLIILDEEDGNTFLHYSFMLIR